jgi:sensor histidine kinase YesM
MTILSKPIATRGPAYRNFIAIHMQQHPFIFSDERKYRIQRHLAFWIFWWLFQGVMYSTIAIRGAGEWTRYFPVSIAESLCFMPNHIFLGYTLMYFVIPRFLLKQKYWLTAAWTLIAFLVTASISSVIGMFVVPAMKTFVFNYQDAHPNQVQFHLAMMAGLRGGITIGGIAAAIKLMKYWYVKEQRNLQLQKENMESQLQLLKAQIHPHFLFNTLNNIYSYTQNTSPAAAGMVTALSDMLRFMLYECNQPLVPLSKELKLINDYINLEQIRYGNRLELHLYMPGRTNDLYIAPLLLLPLIENCFKHGTSHVLDNPWINLQIVLEGKQMRMKLINGKVDTPGNEKLSHGIGISNVRKRLDFLYQGKHELEITSDEDVFIVNLKIELEQKESSFTTASQPKLTHA